NVIIRKLKVFVQKTTTEIDNVFVDLIEHKIVPFLYLGTFYFSMQGLKMAPAVQKAFTVTISLLLTILIVRAISVLLSVILEQHWASKDKNMSRRNAFKSLLTGIQIVMWAIAVVMLLDNFGVNISTLITGLGIGGIAIAIASQAVLGDLFSYFTIIFDRPFEIGDFIIVGDRMGTVEHIGMKSTRVRSLSGEQLVFRNTDLTDSRISNYKRMENRRVVFSLGVTYDTDIATLKEIPLKIKNIIESIPLTKFDRSHFFSYGNFSLNFETVYYVASSDYNIYMDIHQEINFRIMEAFKSMGAAFAFPTQTLHIVPDKGSSSLLSAT
ncbi:MAG: mechanosensitive ion channel family protein, partial [Fibrobacterota bacterium]